MTAEEARVNLVLWLDMAVADPVHNRYDQLCHEAFLALGEEEYGQIWERWAAGWVSTGDGYYVRR